MALDVTGVRKSYGDRPVLVGVDLRIAPGEVVGLMGLNGAGKTTLMSVISGIRKPDAGTVTVGGVDAVRRPHRARRLLGYAPQDLGIYPSVTVRENLRFFGEVLGLRGARLRRRVDEVAVALQLDQLLQRPARQLSGGEQRRLHTAVALLHQPPVLLLDEPTVGVDVATRAQLLEVVRALADDGAAVCYTTHYLTELETIADTVAVLHEGRILAHHPLKEMLQEYGTPALELTFETRAPEGLDLGPQARVSDRVITISTPEPARAAATTLPHLGPYAAELQAVHLVQPNLDTVFTRLTGRRIGEEDPT